MTVAKRKFDPKLKGRSRLTNGKLTIAGNSTWARRVRDLIVMHEADLGGRDNCSTGERSIIRRIATLSAELERLEFGIAEKGQATAAELALYSTTSNTLRRLLVSIGLQRRAKDITPKYRSYAEQVAAEMRAAEAAE